MASFHYNPFSNESSLLQWNRYLQQREFNDDIKGAINAQTRTYQDVFHRATSIVSSAIGDLNASVNDASRRQVEAIDDASWRQVEAIAQAAEVVVGSLETGFDELSSKLIDINASVERVGARVDQLGIMLDWRLSTMIDQQRISNLLLENIVVSLRVPDFQKERQYYVEQGFKHYKNAALDADLYEDALENLLEAEKREKTDYVVLHRIGLIYLYQPALADIVKAETYLRRAAKYAIAEAAPTSQRTLNILAGDVNKKLAHQTSAVEAIKTVAAGSYFQAGIACYVQKKLTEAIDLWGKAFSLLPTLLEAGFLKAKALAACGDESQAAGIVEYVIKAERFYAVKTAADADLSPKPTIQNLLKRLRDEAVALAKDRVEKCRSKLLPNSEAAPLLIELEHLIENNTYLDALRALDDLIQERKWKTAPAATISIESFISFRWEAKSKRHDDRVRQQADRARLDAEIGRLIEEQRQQKRIKQQAEEERRLQEQLNQQRAQIKELMAKAKAERQHQDKKWFNKDYSQAIAYYEQAARLGSEDAQKQVEELKWR